MMSKTRGPVPPIILLACILSEIGLHYKLPLTELIPAPWHWFGVAMIVVGVLIIIGPALAFLKADTTIIPFEESSKLVVTGMYR